MSVTIIKTEKLTKTFGELVAVDSLDLSIQKGEIYGLLGPNGAGKTTTVRMLCGLARPTAGSAVIDGLDVAKDPVGVRRVLGIVPQCNTLDRDLTVRENLVYHSKLHGLSKEYYTRRIDDVLDFVDLKEKTHAAPLTLSGGMKRRFTIAKALVHEPKVLFLDEPTTGLDPRGRQAVWKKILELKDAGKTVVLTTHYMDEAELLCDRIGIINCGKLTREGTVRELKALVKNEVRVEVEFMSDVDLKPLKESGLILRFEKLGRHTILLTNKREELFVWLLEKHAGVISSLNIIEPRLENVFLTLTENLGGGCEK